VTLGITAPIAGSLSDRVGTRPITALGLSILLIGYLAMGTLDTQTTALGFIVRILPIGVGMGVFQSPNNSAIMSVAPRERLGVVSGLLTITRTLGQTTGIAALGALWAAQVISFYGAPIEGGATAAPAMAQVAGLQGTLLVVTGLMTIGLLVSVWGLFEERKLRRATAAQSNQ
jgi:MFS family permease